MIILPGKIPVVDIYDSLRRSCKVQPISGTDLNDSDSRSRDSRYNARNLLIAEDYILDLSSGGKNE